MIAGSRVQLFLCFIFLTGMTGCLTSGKPSSPLPQGFVFLTDMDPTIIEHSRYAMTDNFLGHPVDGYTQPRIVCTHEAAVQLKRAHDMLKERGYTLVVYDGYRPQRAVEAFKRWSLDLNDQVTKAFYYPTIDKKDAFKLGYIAEKSSHSRGSTFDLTLMKLGQKLRAIQPVQRQLANGDSVVYLDDGTVDMGTSFDLFHEASHHDAPLMTGEPLVMRNLLRHVMVLNGFKPYAEEWWHYTLAVEPYPETYFTFIVNEAEGV